MLEQIASFAELIGAIGVIISVVYCRRRIRRRNLGALSTSLDDAEGP